MSELRKIGLTAALIGMASGFMDAEPRPSPPRKEIAEHRKLRAERAKKRKQRRKSQKR